MRSSFLELSSTGLSLFGQQRAHWGSPLFPTSEKFHRNHLQTILTMLYHKPLVSLVAAIALASGVTASATPVRRNDGSQCNPETQKAYCCETQILGLIALGCVLTPLCADGTAVCCDQDVEQHGLININLGCIIL